MACAEEPILEASSAFAACSASRRLSIAASAAADLSRAVTRLSTSAIEASSPFACDFDRRQPAGGGCDEIGFRDKQRVACAGGDRRDDETAERSRENGSERAKPASFLRGRRGLVRQPIVRRSPAVVAPRDFAFDHSRALAPVPVDRGAAGFGRDVLTLLHQPFARGSSEKLGLYMGQPHRKEIRPACRSMRQIARPRRDAQRRRCDRLRSLSAARRRRSTDRRGAGRGSGPLRRMSPPAARKARPSGGNNGAPRRKRPARGSRSVAKRRGVRLHRLRQLPVRKIRRVRFRELAFGRVPPNRGRRRRVATRAGALPRAMPRQAPGAPPGASRSLRQRAPSVRRRRREAKPPSRFCRRRTPGRCWRPPRRTVCDLLPHAPLRS